jgi:siroheme synthase (precorrin-2 oxidase/ferrochelatase)
LSTIHVIELHFFLIITIFTMPVPLLTSVDCVNQVHLVIGDNGIAAKRTTRSLEAGAVCILLSPKKLEDLHFDLKNLIETGRIKHVQREFQEDDLKTFGRIEVDYIVDMVFVTLSPLDKRGNQFHGLNNSSKLDCIAL